MKKRDRETERDTQRRWGKGGIVVEREREREREGGWGENRETDGWKRTLTYLKN